MDRHLSDARVWDWWAAVPAKALERVLVSAATPAHFPDSVRDG
jgi:hypothetical protein